MWTKPVESAYYRSSVKPYSEPESILSLPEIPVFVAINGRQAGPFSRSTLQQMAQSGLLTKDSLVWMQGMDKKWEVASTVTYITILFNAVTPPDDEPPPEEI